MIVFELDLTDEPTSKFLAQSLHLHLRLNCMNALNREQQYEALFWLVAAKELEAGKLTDCLETLGTLDSEIDRDIPEVPDQPCDEVQEAFEQ